MQLLKIIFTLFIFIFTTNISISFDDYYIPNESEYIPNNDSILFTYFDTTNTYFKVDQKKYGNVIWFSDSETTFDTETFTSSIYILTEKHIIKQIEKYNVKTKMIISKSQIVSDSHNDNRLWDKYVDVELLDNSTIQVRTDLNSKAKIFKYKDWSSSVLAEINITSSKNEYKIPKDLDQSENYLIVFYDKKGIIASIKPLSYQ